ncbi:MAG: ATP-grasp domain-containing protein [Halothiobacillaceae bacterium]
MPLKIWFNKSFSVTRNLLDLIREGDKGQNLTLLASHSVNTAMARLAADIWFVEPELSGQAYVDWCLQFCAEQQVTLFVPGKAAINIARRLHEFHAIGTRVLLCADVETLILLDNKAAFSAAVDQTQTPTAETVEINNIEAFQAAYAELKQRHTMLCLKPSVSVFGLGFRMIDETHDALDHILAGQEQMLNLHELTRAMQAKLEFKPSLILMEYLAGEEWSVDCVADDGELIYAIQRRKSNELSTPQYIDNHPDIARMTDILTRQFKLNGLFNIQFRRGEHGIRVLEINARPSGGSPVACASGINLPFEAVLRALAPEDQALLRAHSLPAEQHSYGLHIHQTMQPCALAL